MGRLIHHQQNGAAMSEDTIKLAAKLPKGELNGFTAGLLADDLCTSVVEGRIPAPHVAVLILDVKKVEVDPETGARTAVLGIRRVQPVRTNAGRKAVESVLFDEYSIDNGPVMPHDVAAVTAAAFTDLPRSLAEVDEREAREQDQMTDADELRRHLARVHQRDEALTMTEQEAIERHRADHAGDELPEHLRHAEDWLGWTRADIEAAEAESEDFALDGDLDGPDHHEDQAI
jgi:hypothetical protein